VRIARVHTNETCNQNCTFCDRRSPVEDRDFVARAAVEMRIEQAASGGAEIILTGGEPTLRRDLAALIAHARACGASKVTLETNAALITPERAAELASAGLDVARVHLPTWGPALERITRDPDGRVATEAALRSLEGAGIAVEAAAPVVRSNVRELPELPRRLSEQSGVAVRALVLGVPTDGPDAGELLPLREAAEAIEAAEAAARRVGMPLRMETDSLIPPCLFARPGRLAHLYSLTPGGQRRDGWEQLPACERCVARDRCPGFPRAALERDPDLEPRPIEDDQVRRRLSLISTIDEQIGRELFQDDVYRRDGGVAVPARIVRINFRCNQACHFCFVSTHLPTASDDAVEKAIVDIARRGGVLVLSGGEPTLNPRLLDYVRLGKREGAVEIELQTNAMNLAGDALAARLKDAGVDQAFISLHGSTAAISDAVTDAPGTFVKTVAGIDAVMQTGMRTRINFVFCETNYADFPRYVEMVSERWPGAGIVVSFVAGSTDVVPRSKRLIPRYSDVLPSLARGIRRAEELGTTISGFESMCGIPLCLVPTDLVKYFDLAEIPEEFDRGEFMESDACTHCDLLGRCFGVRRGYAELHGTDEFVAVTRAS
jgi:MoaA/NifB/PqqE/SkfB family radical SAM enzyme